VPPVISVPWPHGVRADYGDRVGPDCYHTPPPAPDRSGQTYGCHIAQSRSTLQCSKKNSGSRAQSDAGNRAPKLVCANPCGLPSKFRKARYWLPSASVCVCVSSPGGAEEAGKWRERLDPLNPSVVQN